MVDFLFICPNCCKESDNGGICSACGALTADVKNEEFCVPAGTVLLDRYYIGKVIGQGGFGITYLGYDTKLKTKIAVKEYFPHGYAYRELHKDTHTVYTLSGEKTEFFNRGMEKFIAEARRLARFSGAPGIVNVRDYFNENNTAYIVMEFVEGEPLKALLEKRGKLSEAETIAVFLPILKTLQRVHAAGILHRDIAPDNIMVEPDGTARLIDFGASAEVDETAATSAAVIKQYYVPEEQYDKNRRRQGSWTDVYAVSASVFRTLEGTTLPDAIERLRGVEFKGFTVPVSKAVSNAVMHGLALFAKDRAQTVDELIEVFSERERQITYEKPKKEKKPKPEKEPKPQKEKTAKIEKAPKSDNINSIKSRLLNSPKIKIVSAVIASAVVISVFAAVILPRLPKPLEEEITLTETTTTATTTAVTTAAPPEDTTTVNYWESATSTNFWDAVTSAPPPEDTTTETTATTTEETTAEETTTTTASSTTASSTTTSATTKPATTTSATTTARVTTTATTAATTLPADGQVTNFSYNGGKYTGYLKGGKPNGEGTLSYSSGWVRRYIGEFKDGKYEGQGTLHYENGGRYEGGFKNGLRNGKGKEYFPDDGTNEYIIRGTFSVDEGTYLNGQLIGDYTYTEEQKDCLYVRYVNAEEEKTGSYTFHVIKTHTDGIIEEWDEVYVNGVWKEMINYVYTGVIEDVKDLPWEDGTYTGQILDGKPHGKGTLYIPLSPNETYFKVGTFQELIGNWENGGLRGEFIEKFYLPNGVYNLGYWKADEDGNWLGRESNDPNVHHVEQYNAQGKLMSEWDDVFENGQFKESINEKKY